MDLERATAERVDGDTSFPTGMPREDYLDPTLRTETKSRGGAMLRLVDPEAPSQLDLLVEAIQSGEYFPMGLERQRRNEREHFVKTWAIIDLMRAVMARAAISEKEVFLMVADCEPNFQAKLEKAESQKPEAEQRPTEILAAESKKIARLTGTMEALRIEAIKEMLLVERPSKKLIAAIRQAEEDYLHADAMIRNYDKFNDQDDYLKYYRGMKTEAEARALKLRAELPPTTMGKNSMHIVQLSDVAEHPDFETIYAEVKALVDSDPELAEEVFALVQKEDLPKNHRGKPFAKINGKYKRIARVLMEYVEHQIATSILLLTMQKKKQGKKLGHPGETKYDDLTRQVAARLSRPLNEDPFEAIDLPKGLPYRGNRVDKTGDDSLSLVGDWGDTIMRGSEKRAINRTPGSRGDQMIEAAHARQAQAHETLEEKSNVVSDIYRRLFQKITEAEMDERDRTHIMELAIMHYTQEVVQALANRAHMQVVFKELGVLDVIAGQRPASELGQGSLIPFQCPQREGESENAYFSRFVGELLRGGMTNGPMGDLSSRMQSLHEMFYSYNIWILAWENGLLEGYPDAEAMNEARDQESNHWLLPCGNIRYRLLARTQYRPEWKNETEQEEDQWQLLGRLFTLIRGTHLETALREYYTDNTPENPFRNTSSTQTCAPPDEANIAEIERILESPILNEQFTAFLRARLINSSEAQIN